MAQNCTIITADMTREFEVKGRVARHNSSGAASGGLRYNERAKNDLLQVYAETGKQGMKRSGLFRTSHLA